MISTYASSGVDISEGDSFVEIIKPLVKSTFTKNVLSGIGNFGAFYKIPKGYQQPVFVSSTDGVGTKLKVAIAAGRYDSIGEDIVNHCVNDIAVCGAKPLYFLDYLAFGKLKKEKAVSIVKGMVKAAKENGCSLIGGETAEMPGVYNENEFDLAGTIVGIVEKKNIINKKNVRKGDVLIGIRSNGLHTNGYSLARKVLLNKFDTNEYIDELGCKLSEELLKVHTSYLNVIQDLIKKINVSSFSHITGGGISGNTERVIPERFKLKIDWTSWEWNPIFELIRKTGNISINEMRKVFNLGIGLIVICKAKDAENAINIIKRKKHSSYIIGEVLSK